MPTAIEIQGAIRMRRLADLWLPRAMESRLLLKLFPLMKVDETGIIYERRQVRTGLQGARGLNGSTTSVLRPGRDQYRVPASYYGDNYPITEEELVNIRKIADWENFMSYQDHAKEGTEYLTQRFLDRCEYSIAQILTTGGYTSQNIQGITYYQQIFNLAQYTPTILFSDLTNSQPINFFRDLIPQLELLRSINFTKGFILCSKPSLNLLLKNQNPADINGRRLSYGETINSEDELNEIMVANDLPPFKTYDEGYYLDPPGSPFDPPPYQPGTATRFIANGSYILCGVRDDGENIGEYRLTRAAQNEKGSPGEWYTVEDNRDMRGDKCNVILRAGHNGGPWVKYLEGIAIVNGAAASSFAAGPDE